MKEIKTFAIACAVSAAIFFPAAMYINYNNDTNVAQRELDIEKAGDVAEALRYEKNAILAAAAEKARQQENIAKAAAFVAKKDAEKAKPEKIETKMPPTKESTHPKARVASGAAYLPARFNYLMPELRNAIDLVAQRHVGCESIANASLSENYSSKATAAYFVSCKMSGKTYPYQNVYVKNGAIVATTP